MVQITLPFLQDDPANSIVLEVLVVGKDMLCNLWQVPVKQSQYGSLWFGIKVMPYESEN